MSDQLNVAEAEKRAKKLVESFHYHQLCNHVALDFLALAALYREENAERERLTRALSQRLGVKCGTCATALVGLPTPGYPHDASCVEALYREAQKRIAQLEASMIGHFQREHIEGDGPEIDRWKARYREEQAKVNDVRNEAEENKLEWYAAVKATRMECDRSDHFKTLYREAVEALEKSAFATCSLLCPSVWKTGTEQPHCNTCRLVRAVLAKARAALQGGKPPEGADPERRDFSLEKAAALDCEKKQPKPALPLGHEFAPCFDSMPQFCSLHGGCHHECGQPESAHRG